MKQNIKIAVAALAGFAVGFALIKLLSAQKEEGSAIKQDSTEGLKSGKSENEKPEKANYKDDSFPLELGSRGQKVERLQVYLMRNLGWVRKPNGIFDLLTEERCRRYFKQDRISKALYEKLMMDKMVHDQRKSAA